MATLVGIIALIPFVLSFQLKTRNNIILANLTSRILFILQYILLGAYVGATFDFIGLLSSIVARKKDKPFVAKYQIAIIIFINALILAAGIALYKNIYSIICLIGIILEIAALWLTKERDIRIVSFLSAPFWLIYNIASMAYASVPGNVLAMVSIGVALFRYDIPKKEKHGGDIC